MTDRPACNVQPGDILTAWCACGHLVGMHSRAPIGDSCAVCDQLDALHAEITRLRAGADPTTPEEAAQLTPGQIWHRLTTADPDDRQQLLARIAGDLDTASRCFVLDHEGAVEDLKRTRAHANRYAAALREVVATLGPDTVCGCTDTGTCGLRDEAADALRTAREALGSDSP